MVQKVKLLFFIYKSKINQTKQAPIYARVTVNKERKHFSTGFFVKIPHWDSKTHRVKKLNHTSKQINAYLDTIDRKVIELALKFEYDRRVYSAEDFISELLGRKNMSIESLLAVFKKHNEGVRELIGKSYTRSTYQKFEGIYKQVHDFIKYQYGKKDILLLNLKLKFVLDFEHYLLVTKNLKQVSINKSIQRLRKIIKFAILHEYLEKDPFSLYKAKSINLDIVYLSPEELAILEEYNFENDRLAKVKDCFVFCCYTGLVV